jgi:phosphoribosylaminoimidazole carboxylase PurE protein
MVEALENQLVIAEYEDAVLRNPPVDLIMGSDSDTGVVIKAVKVLDEFGIDYDARVLSAHRTPDDLAEYCDEVRDCKAGRIILAFAGMSAALPGTIQAMVNVPVIGVPVESAVNTQNSAVGSMIDLPPGQASTLVGPNQGDRAAREAVRILGLLDPVVRKQINEVRESQRQGVLKKDLKMRELGLKKYMEAQASGRK